MRATPTLAQLRAFVAIADYQHFQDAAASIGLSQPSLSQSLAALEERLGVLLIERNPRKVLVTAAGEHLLPLARAALAAIDVVAAAGLRERPLVGPLHVGMIPTIAPYLLPSILPALLAQAPELQLNIHEDQTDRLLDALAAGGIDVAILALPTGDPRVLEEALFNEDFVLAVPPQHPWTGRSDVSVVELGEEQLLFLEEGHCLREQTMQVCVQSGIVNPGETKARAASLSTIVQLVAAGLGMTFLPESAIQVETRGAQLGVSRFVDPAPGRRVGLVYRRTSTRAEEFAGLAEILRGAVANGIPAVRIASAPAT